MVRSHLAQGIRGHLLLPRGLAASVAVLQASKTAPQALGALQSPQAPPEACCLGLQPAGKQGATCVVPLLGWDKSTPPQLQLHVVAS